MLIILIILLVVLFIVWEQVDKWADAQKDRLIDVLKSAEDQRELEKIRLEDALSRRRAAEEAYLRYLTNQDESQAKE
ncbi:MAG: hypothetical protein ABIL62_13655 [Planctomycetota bacterium]